MSYRKPIIQAFKAGADLRAAKNTWVKFGANQQTVVAAGNDESPDGILMNAPNTGETAEVALIGGGAELKVNGAVSPGASIACAAGGKGKPVTSGGAYAVAKAEATADGDIIAVDLDRHTGVA